MHKLLLVDDEEGIRTVLGISLQDLGYEVIPAENAGRALELFFSVKPDIVVTDIKMPGMDGIRLLRRLKTESPDTEVIVITGHGDMELAIQSLKYEATDFITKPIDDDLLEKALEKARERIWLRKQLRNYTQGLEGLLLQKTEQLAQAMPGSGPAAHYRDLFESLPGYVTVHSRDFHITAANRRFKEDFGDPDSETPCHALVKGSDEPCIDCPVEQTFADNRPQQREMKLNTQDGRRLDLFAWTTLLQGGADQADRVMLMSMDISQVVDLRDRLASLGLMIGSVSHGIKGLLTGLDGGLYMINSGVSREDPERVHDGIETVRQMTGRIRNLVLDILYYAKERKLHLECMKVNEFMEETSEIIAPRVDPPSLRLFTQVDPRLKEASFEADREQLRSALVNLLENALEACHADESREAHEVRFTAGAMDHALVFQVEDNGIGMDANTREQLFTLFFSTKRSHGTGIGLFISKKIVQQHGGEIQVDSTPGQGSRFRVVIPCLPDAQEECRGAADREENRQ